MQPLTRMIATVPHPRVFATTGVGTQPNIPGVTALLRQRLAFPKDLGNVNASTLGPDRNKRGWRQRVDIDASHPSFVAGRRADAIKNRLFAHTRSWPARSPLPQLVSRNPREQSARLSPIFCSDGLAARPTR